VLDQVKKNIFDCKHLTWAIRSGANPTIVSSNASAVKIYNASAVKIYDASAVKIYKNLR
jgi:hypothetical protein